MIIQIIYSLFALALSLAFGSFTNVLIYRIPRGMSLLKPASSCPSCNGEILIKDNIPILSHILLKGQCRFCGVEISRQYMLIEAVVTIVSLPFIAKYVLFEFSPLNFIFSLIFISIAVALAVIDHERQMLPHELTFSAILLALTYASLINQGTEALAAVGATFFFFDMLTHFGNRYYYGEHALKVIPGALTFHREGFREQIDKIYIYLFALIAVFAIFYQQGLMFISISLGLLYVAYEIFIDFYFNAHRNSASSNINELMSGSQDQESILGGGDVAMLAFVAAVTQVAFLNTLILACVLALIYAASLSYIRTKKFDLQGQKIPFGAALAASLITVMILNVVI